MRILYRLNPDYSFEFREVENLDDYDELLDGRLYYQGDEDDEWFELLLDSELYDASDDYVQAFVCYRLEQPDLFAKVKKWDNFCAKQAKHLNAGTREERSERAQKAVMARWAKKKNAQI